jgi:A/G-specific adenine glycosylase
VANSELDQLLARRKAFGRALLDWYRQAARPLPWRVAPSPYKTVVSEFMLQQTRVSTVLPYFARWMAAFPDWKALAGATEESVLKLWEGLGYYSRARRLHRLAGLLAGRPGMPRSRGDWEELPGVGPYTAAAISSIAFGEPAACVDGNVVRILARLVADGTRFRDGSAAAKAFAPAAGGLLSRAAPGDHNQAMMELGATVCLPENPRCPACPVRRFCAAARKGRPAGYPRIAPKRRERRTVLRVWCRRRGALLMHRAARSAPRLAGQHELPTPEQAGVPPRRAAGGALLATRTRGITRFSIVESIHRAPSPRGRLDDSLVWVPLDRLDSVILSGPHRRWIGEILASRPTTPQGGASTRARPRRSPWD